MKTLNIILLTFMFFTITACDTVSDAVPDWLGGGEEKAQIPGKRISVLALNTKLRADAELDDVEVLLPTLKSIDAWPLQRTAPVANPALKKKLSGTTRIKIGKGARNGTRLTSNPVIANGVIYTLDAEGIITARSIKNLKKILWKVEIFSGEMNEDLLGIGVNVGFGNRKVKKEFLGGNIAYGNKAIFVTTGRGEVMALGSVTGTKIWQRNIKIPVKSAPVASDGKLFVITNNNKLYALDGKTGKTLWTHSGIKERTMILGSSSPVVKGGVIIVPYSSGEIHAFRIATGKRMWGDLLVSNHAASSSISLNDIDATPVIAGGKVFAVSNDGSLSAFDLIDGTKLWSKDISSLKTPWVAGDFIYVITSEFELACIYTKNGKIKWVHSLPANDEVISIFGLGKRKQSDAIEWSGPVLAGNKLLLIGSHGKLASFSPRNGDITDVIDIDPNGYMPPVIAEDSIFILTNDARLIMIY